jgi:hypothetical protein
LRRAKRFPRKHAPTCARIGAIDAALGGGLECAALHELSTTPGQFGATGFAIALAALAREPGQADALDRDRFRHARNRRALRPGLDQFGLAPSGC